MRDELQVNWQQVVELAKRMRPGYRAFCAYIDLLGMKETMTPDHEETIHRNV